MENIPKINFVTETPASTWILRRWCEEWSKRIPNSSITSLIPSYDADVNIFVNYALYKPVGKTICVFTHREDDSRGMKFDAIARQCNWCFGQSDYTMSLLPEDKSSKLSVGIGEHFYKDRPLRLGVVGRYYPSGRKRTHWIPKLNEIEGVEVVFTDGKWEYEDMPDFYDEFDYILVTANKEGGPMTPLESQARYKPLIVPVGVGWCDEFPAIRYQTYEELEQIVRGLIPNRDRWEGGATQIIEKARQLCYK